MSSLEIWVRNIREVNTDYMRRCYYGVHAKSELVWGPWYRLEFVNKENVDERLKFWRELNYYAVSQRGQSAKSEFEVREVFNESLFKRKTTEG